MTPYSKLNSQGNDFILVEKHLIGKELTRDNIKSYCSRDKIGCDQFFIIDTVDKKNIKCRIYNQDGTEAHQCGNGLRATMLYLKKKYNLDSSNIMIGNTSYHSKIVNNLISVNMGSPTFIECPENIREEIILTKDGLVIHVELKNDLTFSFMPLSIGNEHSIVLSQGCLENKNIISKSLKAIFGYEMNIGFIENAIEFRDDISSQIKLTVNERGAGYTESCGSGATAAAICLYTLYEYKIGQSNNNLKIKIKQKGGLLEVTRNFTSNTYELIGPSTFDGEGYLD